jgi:hypothetical protein
VHRIQELLKRWESAPDQRLTASEYRVRLPLRDAARLQALTDLYPDTPMEEIITDLLSLALDEVESSLPYVPGTRIVEHDEYGDPIYEDIGPSKRFHEASQTHLEALRRQTSRPPPTENR